MYTANTPVQEAAVVDTGLRSYMLKVYNLMAGGLALSALTAYSVAHTSLRSFFFSLDVQGHPHMTGATILCAIVPFILIFAAKFGQMRSWSSGAMHMVYWTFTACLGVTLSAVLLNRNIDVIHPFLATVIAFSGLSIVGYTTNRDLSPVGSFCIMGLWGLIGMGLIEVFTGFHVNTLLSGIVGVIVFAGLTAWDTQKIKTNYLQNRDNSVGAAVWDAMDLYLDAINLFMEFVKIFNSGSSSDD